MEIKRRREEIEQILPPSYMLWVHFKDTSPSRSVIEIWDPIRYPTTHTAPVPYQNVMDPQHSLQRKSHLRIPFWECAASAPISTFMYLWAIYIFAAVFRIHDILVCIRIRGSMPLTNGSGSRFRSRFGSGSCYFRHWPSRRQQKII